MGSEELDTNSLAHTSRDMQDVFVPNHPGVNALRHQLVAAEAGVAGDAEVQCNRFPGMLDRTPKLLPYGSQ